MQGVWVKHSSRHTNVATLAQEDCNVGEVRGRADKALYEAKSAGRGRVAVS